MINMNGTPIGDDKVPSLTILAELIIITSTKAISVPKTIGRLLNFPIFQFIPFKNWSITSPPFFDLAIIQCQERKTFPSFLVNPE